MEGHFHDIRPPGREHGFPLDHRHLLSSLPITCVMRCGGFLHVLYSIRPSLPLAVSVLGSAFCRYHSKSHPRWCGVLAWPGSARLLGILMSRGCSAIPPSTLPSDSAAQVFTLLVYSFLLPASCSPSPFVFLQFLAHVVGVHPGLFTVFLSVSLGVVPVVVSLHVPRTPRSQHDMVTDLFPMSTGPTTIRILKTRSYQASPLPTLGTPTDTARICSNRPALCKELTRGMTVSVSATLSTQTLSLL